MVICANHTSFLDAIMIASESEMRTLPKMRSMCGAHLLKMPLLGTCVRSVGHFLVWFKSSEDGVFKLDADKMKKEEAMLDEHLASGGWFTFFPEGALNKTPREGLQSFRYGGIKRLLKHDAFICLWAHCGCEIVWPVKAPIGGFPCNLWNDFKLVAPKGARALVADFRAENVPGEAELEDHVLLAHRLQAMTQKMYLELVPKMDDVQKAAKKKQITEETGSTNGTNVMNVDKKRK